MNTRILFSSVMLRSPKFQPYTHGITQSVLSVTQRLAIHSWYYTICPECNTTLSHDPQSGSTALSCEKHPEQVGYDIYKLNIRLEDKENSLTAVMIGRPADKLFGITCDVMVNKIGYKDKTKIPDMMNRYVHRYYVWKIGYGHRQDFLIKGVFLDNEDGDEDTIHADEDSVHTGTTDKNSNESDNEEEHVQSGLKRKRHMQPIDDEEFVQPQSPAKKTINPKKTEDVTIRKAAKTNQAAHNEQAMQPRIPAKEVLKLKLSVNLSVHKHKLPAVL